MFNRLFFMCAAAAALGAPMLAQGQWPARYNLNNGIDEAQAVAVDRWGNVYVTGKAYHGSLEGYNIITTSYDSSGNVRSGWPQQFNGEGSGDDIPTSIAVDADGNVYVGGTTYSGDDFGETGFDLMVIKYTSTGSKPWPASGGGTGYAFTQGAVRTTSTEMEGTTFAGGGAAGDVFVSMDVRQSFNAENRLIAVSGVVVQNGTDWRTVVFEPDPNNPGSVRLKSGFPVDYGGSLQDLPRDVAIHSDNSVYVTGKDTQGMHNSRFKVVKIHPTGTNHTSDGLIWTYDWQDFKDNQGIALVLDADNVYATGELAGGEFEVDYGTVCIDHDQASSTANHVWQAIYDNTNVAGGMDAPKSIDLTFEVVNGVVKTFVWVTGESQGTGGDKDIATVRYESAAGVEQFVRRYAGTGDDIGFMVVGAGNGNAYVVGRSSNDYIVQAMRKTNTLRFNEVFYDNGGLDEGRAGTMQGAGAILATGTSFATSQNLDFLTKQWTQTVTTYNPDGYNLTRGSLGSGTLSDLTSDNDSYMKFLYGNDVNRGPQVEVEFSKVIPETIDPSEITFNVVAKTTWAGVDQKVEAYDWTTSSWELVDSRDSTSTDMQLVLVMKSDPHKYMDPLTRTVKFRLSWEETTYTTPKWQAWVDMVSWDVIGA